MHKANPDVLYFTGYYPEAGLIIRQMKELGSKALFVGGNAAINDEFVQIAGIDVAKGALILKSRYLQTLSTLSLRCFSTNIFVVTNPPPSSPWPVYAADALKAIAAAIDATGSTDSKVLADYLRDEMEGLPGITGPIAFNEVGDREGAIYLAYEVTADGEPPRPYQP